MIKNFKYVLTIPVIVAALGYFVDIYDLILFGIVREESLASLGIIGKASNEKGLYLLNVQMIGMLIGGILWGIWGDKKGRLSVLFGSILLYSIANITNGFITSLDQYVLLRFIAGVGLAGELGAGITLAAEMLPKEIRGYGTTLIATVGVLGAVLAYLVSDFFDWRTAYFFGGGLGIMLLIARVKILEPSMFASLKEKNIQRGNFLKLFTKKSLFYKYIKCILIGMPLWFIIGILITFSPMFSKELGIAATITAGKSIMFAYIGLSAGDLTSGIVSQKLKSRKKAVFLFLTLTLLFVLLYLFNPSKNEVFFYFICSCLGFSVGYWAIFVTIAAEQFGTNLRATVATTVPNFVRGSLVIISILFNFAKINMGTIYAALSVGIATIIIALISLYLLDETFGKDLDYIESH